jgi:adenylosuccinate synthase
MQYGSTGKGALAHLLGEQLQPDVAMTAWGPNAGHTAINAAGHKFVHTMLANSLVCHSVCTQLIGPGSVVNLDSLLAEAKAARSYLAGKRIVIHPNACILQPRHAEAEKVLARIGSTMKGTSAATIDKIWRDPYKSPLARDAPMALYRDIQKALAMIDVQFCVSEQLYNSEVATARHILIEGAQGFSLGSHTKFWPHTTSRDVSVTQLLADCRIPFDTARGATVWGTMRTFPIRVANRYDAADGSLVGTSGACYDDQTELDWQADLGREPELTTVTRLPRRVFTFSAQQAREAAWICSPNHLVLTFADYVAPQPEYGQNIGEKLSKWLVEIESWTGVRPRILTFGPTAADAIYVDDVFTAQWLSQGSFSRWFK